MKLNERKLAVALAEKGWNFKRLADESGVSRTTLSYINCGKRCTPETAGKIAQALDKSVEYLIQEDGHGD